MNFTVTETLTIVGTVIALVTAIQAGRKAKADNEKTRSDTAAMYQTIAQKCAEAKAELIKLADELRAQVKTLEEDIGNRDSRIEDMESAVISRDRRIDELSRQLTELNDLIAIKDGRIEELERLTAEQTSEIEHLRTEIEALRSKRRRQQ